MKRFGVQKAYLVCTLIMSVFISILSGCGGGGGGEWKKPVTTSAVTVTSTDPADGETGVFLNTKVNATFSGAVDPASLTTATFTVKQGTTTVPGTVTFTPVTAVFSPAGNLLANTTYIATVTTGVKDSDGKALASDYVWSFTTGTALDSAAPTVTGTINANNATGVPINTKVGATFSKAMDSTTINSTTFTFKQGTATVPGKVSYSGLNAVFTPDSNLAPNTLYTATITTGAKDLTVPGNALASNFVWSWTTGGTLDITPPKVITENPANLAANVTINSVVRATFDKAMDPLTITSQTFTLKAGATTVKGLVTYDALSRIATFRPSGNLLANTKYTATVTTGAKDISGNVLASGLVPNPWTFTTANTVVVPPASAVPLGSAGTFGIMATSAITNTGAATMINGDVSLNPGSSNGLLPVQVNGAIHINDTVSEQARADLLAAYNTAKNLPPGTTVSGGADLGALKPGGVLPPGTYTSGSTMLVSTPLTLNGSATDVWIFQIGSSLTTTANVILGPGVLAKNVFWVPTLDATVGVNSTFSGTIVSGRDVTAKTGATINGRILAGATLAGTIALDTNTVNVPAP
ncbi:MAG: Ig-like domain-containing protein [Steroidobacteraceae bacterium]|nr:Ig-like domain-containing protein [Deltaproteobacteria bacterium]